MRQKGLRIVSYTVLITSYPVSNAHHTLRFLLKKRSVLNAMFGLIGNGKLPYKVLLIISYPLVHVTLDSLRHRHVLPKDTALKR
jgi:hypothetical protein